MNDTVYALAFDASGNLYAGGDFTTAGGVSANYIAKWDGSVVVCPGIGGGWYCSTPLLLTLRALCMRGVIYDRRGRERKIYCQMGRLVVVCPGIGDEIVCVYALAVDASGTLYAGGYFTTAGGVSVKYIAKWDGSSWSALGSGMNNHVFALAC